MFFIGLGLQIAFDTTRLDSLERLGGGIGPPPSARLQECCEVAALRAAERLEEGWLA